MTEINKENIRHIARLSYLHLKEKEVELMQNDLNDILDKLFSIKRDFSSF